MLDERKELESYASWLYYSFCSSYLRFFCNHWQAPRAVTDTRTPKVNAVVEMNSFVTSASSSVPRDSSSSYIATSLELSLSSDSSLSKR